MELLKVLTMLILKRALNYSRIQIYGKCQPNKKTELKIRVDAIKRSYDAVKRLGFNGSFNNFLKKIGALHKPAFTFPGFGGGLDIHKQILKVAPRKGFVLPGHKYTGPGNPLESQLKYDPQTGEILEIYEQPIGRTDAVSMQHDVDYSVYANKPKSEQVQCKSKADRKMVKSLDTIPWKERQ